MVERKLTPAQEQARLQAASSCPECKAIWASFSDDFCDSHTESGWTKLNASKAAPKKKSAIKEGKVSAVAPSAKSKSRQSNKSKSNKWKKRIRVTAITTAVLGGLWWYGNTLEPEETSKQASSASETTPPPVDTTAAEVEDLSWVPNGMQVLAGSEDVAFRYVNPPELDCPKIYRRGKCVGVELVTRDDCGALFAYLRWKDFGGFDVPYDGDTDSKGVTNHRAGVRLKLVFQVQDDLDAIRSGRLDSVDCL